MGNRIVVAGAGHGGLVAAYYLAQAGFDVTVYEQKAEGTLGYEQSDSVHLDGFENAGLPVPEAYRVKRTPLSFIIPGTDVPPITQGVNEDSFNVEIDRKALYDYLLGFAVGAGAKIEYGVKILSPIMLGSRVAGLHTDRGDVYADLVIDAAGLHSPVRNGLPAFTRVDGEPEAYDVLYAYRAYFDRVPGSEDPELKYKVYLVPGKDAGLMWTITHADTVDVLIGSFTPFEKSAVPERLEYLRSVNPQLGETLLRGGDIHTIPVRQPMGILVADGYAAIGDAAFMTIPVKGSGVGYSMRAGKLLAEAVAADENGLYNKETLWAYQTAFYDKIGFDGAMLAIIKDLLPVITAEDIEYVMSTGILTPEALQVFGNEEGMLKLLTAMKLSQVYDTARKIVGHQNLRRMILFTGRKIVRFTMLKQSLKQRYDAKAADKWAAAYNKFYNGVKAGIMNGEKSDEGNDEEI